MKTKYEQKMFPLTNDGMFKLFFTREENKRFLKEFLKISLGLSDE